VIRRLAIAGALLLAVAAGSAPACAQDTVVGTWSIIEQASTTPMRVELRLETDHDSNSTDRVTYAEVGFSPQDLAAPGHHVTFTMTRDAGRLLCDGWAGDGRGAGSFTFVPSASYQAELQRRGYDTLLPRKQLSAALVDLSLAYIDGIRATYPHIEFSKLIAFRALGVDADYVRTMQTRLGPTDADQMISLRALGVTTAYLDEMKQLGFPITRARDAVELRAVGVDADFVRKVEAHGFHNLSIDQLVRARSLGVF
jgi:hypothetical protein